MSKKNSPIHIDVSLDENNIPELIQWSAPDGGIDKEFAQAMFRLFGMEKIRKP